MGTVQLTEVPVQPVYVVNVPSLCRIATVYPVITEPPSAGATKFINTLMPETVVVGAAGVEGAVAIIAPFPAKEYAELPMAF
jgi:hypothetical protein